MGRMGTDSGIHPIQAVCLASSEAQNPAFAGDIIQCAQTSTNRSFTPHIPLSACGILTLCSELFKFPN
jgi:hypothetical protein